MDKRTVTNEFIVLACALRIALLSIDSSYQGGKRGRKAILKSVKKKLMIERKSFVKKSDFDKLEDKSMECLYEARDLMNDNRDDDDKYQTNPGLIIKYISGKNPEFAKVFGFKRTFVENIVDHYIGTGYGMYSIRYARNLMQVSGVEAKNEIF